MLLDPAGSNPGPPDGHSDVHPTEPQRPKIVFRCFIGNAKIFDKPLLQVKITLSSDIWLFISIFDLTQYSWEPETAGHRTGLYFFSNKRSKQSMKRETFNYVHTNKHLW